MPLPPEGVVFYNGIKYSIAEPVNNFWTLIENNY